MMSSIRPMTLNDISDVAEIDALAFDRPPRSAQHLEACLHLNPAGCFVATEPNGHPVGYAFSRIWGSLGWIGVLGVHPDWQGKGFGQALVRAAIAQLRTSGCQCIGLSTSAEKPQNVALYLHLGFLPGFPTLELVKATEPSGKSPPLAFFSQLDRETALEAVRQIGQEVEFGLDYTSEAGNACDYGWGETLLFGFPQPWGVAIVRTVPVRAAAAGKVMDVPILAIPKLTRDRLPEVLAAIEELAYNQNFTQILLTVNASDPDALQQALMCGFRVNRVRIRMTLESSPAPQMGVNLTKWEM
jgi:GNAT superfamily N-acetyltransferase